MSNLLRSKLSVMMGLQFFIWGCWLPLVYSYLPSLEFTPAQQSLILNAFPISAIIGLFFSNQFADRHFAAERFFGFSHLLGGTAMLLLAFTKSFWPFFGLMLLHCLLYVPTVSIVNSIIFAQPTMLVVQSIDKKALKSSRKIQMYCVFGERPAKWNEKDVTSKP